MLYDRWVQVAKSRQNDLALIDLRAGRRWSFGQLLAATSQDAGATTSRFPSGNSADFVLEVLRGWRSGSVICPLEPGQQRPYTALKLPPATVHLKTTSASTGSPRWVAFTAPQLQADADNIVATMGLRPDWPNLGFISLAHSYGFSNLVLPLLLHGIPLVLSPSALPEAVRLASGEAEAVTIAGVPALWSSWLQSAAIPNNLRLAISAGAPLPLELEQQVLERCAVKIHNFYGSSECGGIAYDSAETCRSDAGCAGAPMANVGVAIADDGCVEVRGPAVGETYWPEPNANLRDGVFRTSDLGEILDGRIYLRGRVSDQINVAGRKVAPETIERILGAHPQVRACLAFGVPSADSGRGETIVACVARAATVTGGALKQYAMSHLPAWQVPREWWFVNSLEVNARGKLSRAEWRKRYLQRIERRARGGE